MEAKDPVLWKIQKLAGVASMDLLGKDRRYSIDGHGYSMYFGAFVKYQNTGLSLANSSIPEYLG
jgi:hypothetical protein